VADNDDKGKGTTIGQFLAELGPSRGAQQAIMFVPKGVHVKDDSELEVEVVVVDRATYELMVSLRT